MFQTDIKVSWIFEYLFISSEAWRPRASDHGTSH